MSKFKRVKNLTLDILKFVELEPRSVKIIGPIHLGKAQKAEEGKPAKAPAHLAPCINLEDGTECQIIVSAVVLSVLNDEYPNESYVGKCFEITKKNRVQGKLYFPYGVEEIEDPSKSESTGMMVAEQIPAGGTAKVAEIPHGGKKRA
jgi:hypothetical protein